MIFKALVLALLLAFAIAKPVEESNTEENDRPVIGVLSMEVSQTPFAKEYGNYTSHIAASYVKWLEASGARVVPIMIYKDLDYYKDIISTVNGILIPGGPTRGREYEFQRRMLESAKAADAVLDGHQTNDTDFDLSGYGLSGGILLALAKYMNDMGNYLPVWGTCLGFQLLTIASSLAVDDFRVECAADNLIVPTDFTPDFRSSKMFRDAPNDIINILENEAVTAHYHGYCITEEDMEETGINKIWKILSTNTDFNGLSFVSTTEAINYPFYAVQYHPEKIGFEWNSYEMSPHNANGVSVMQYFGNFFVNEARKNFNKFASLDDERKSLIYQYNPIYTGENTIYEQVYFF